MSSGSSAEGTGSEAKAYEVSNQTKYSARGFGRGFQFGGFLRGILAGPAGLGDGFPLPDGGKLDAGEDGGLRRREMGGGVVLLFGVQPQRELIAIGKAIPIGIDIPIGGILRI
jgi:hypothetical protein